MTQYTCPSCAERFDAPSKYCRLCGASMDRDIATDDTVNSGPHRLATAPTMSSGLASGDASGLSSSLSAGGASDRSSSRSHGRPTRRRVSDDLRGSWLGRVIDNRYRVIEVIGRGGMGMVYKVEHQRMGKIAAMKVLHTEFDNDPEIVERFHREAEAVSRLGHPNTVQVFDFGSSHGSLYLIMELIRGQNLSVLVQRDGPIAFERSGPLFIQICAAVAEAHALGVVHRDLKPENVLVTRTHRGRDFAKVLDFGLAKLSEREEVGEVTDKGLIVGTPYYMSPEQIRGEEVDERTDIYSMGALMYRVLTGAHPFSARTPMGVLTQHLTAELVKPSARAPERALAPELDDLIGRAMAKDRDQRFASMEAFLDEVEQVFLDVCGQSAPLHAVSSASIRVPHPAAETRPHAMDESDEIDYGMLSSVRLQRSDLDEFERSLARRRWLGVSLVPLSILMAVAVVAYVWWRHPRGPSKAEVEPNDQFDRATLIAPGTAVTGYVGRRLDKSRSDHDFFEVRGADVQAVTAHVTALPNMDIELSLVDPTGKVLARADEGAVGQEEWLRRHRVRGPFYVLVTESRKLTLASLPTENVSDSYTLTVELEPIDDERELEPNESPSEANAMHPDQPLMGHLDHRVDVDAYRFEGAAGSYRLTIDGAADVPLAWSLDERPPATERSALVDLSPGAILRLVRTDSALPAAQSLIGVSSPYTLRLVPALR